MKKITFAKMAHVAALLAFAGCERPADVSSAAPAAPLTVKLVTPHRGEITRGVTLPAVVRANLEATLYSKIPGYLKSIAVDKGDSVKEGQQLAEIEVPEMTADLARYKTEAEVANLDFKRIGEARKKAPDLVTPQSLDEARGKFEMAQANLDRIQTLLAYAKITAPFAGVITKRAVDPGAFIPTPTSSAAQSAAIVALADLSKVRVQVAVPETEVRFIANGVASSFTVDGLPGRMFKGTVSRFANVLDEATHTMLAEIDTENADGALRPGMYATVTLTVERKSGALVVPVEAVMVEKAKTSVFRVVGGMAKKTAVKVGFNDGQTVEILDGMKQEESIILVGKLPLNDGQPVQIAK